MKKLSVLLLLNIFNTTTLLHAQEHKPYIRIARIVVDSSSLDKYKVALKKGI